MIETVEQAEALAASLSKRSKGSVRVITETQYSEKLEVWTACYAEIKTPGGERRCLLLHAKKSGMLTRYGDDIHESVRSYFCPDDPEGLTLNMTLDQVAAVTTDDVINMTRENGRIYITCRINIRDPYEFQAIEVSCEVGDSGSGPTAFVPLPCTVDDVQKTLDNVITYARELERETGWAESPDGDAC